MGRDHREHTPGAKARFAEARDAKAKALAYLEAKTFSHRGLAFEDAGDYVVVVGVGDFGALEGHYKGNKNRSSGFAEG